jgi:putative CocE/NonD family hydrolase
MEEAAKTDELFPFGEFDLYNWYLRLGSLKNVNEKYFHGKIPSWNDFSEHVNYDEFWRKQSLPYRLDSPRVQTMHVAGWWDQEDFYGPITAYATLEKQDRNNKNFLVVGPWNHGGWGRSDGRSLGRIDFGSPTSMDYRRDVQAKWFAWQLKGKGNGKFPEAYTFQTGSNTWKSYDKWPPATTTKQKLYFHNDGKLSLEAPSANSEAYDEYVSDPAHPVPYRPRPIEQTYGPHSRWYTWLVEDQRFVEGRPDVLSWQTEVLDKDFTVTGSIFAKLFASSTGTDADWVVKLIDVYPAEYPKDATMGGYQLMVANEVFRGRFRNGFDKPEPLTPGKVETFTIDMRQANHVFKKGHRIMVQVQSTWFPIIDRNPQSYVPNIFQAEEKDFIKATHRIFRDANHASCVEVDAER